MRLFARLAFWWRTRHLHRCDGCGRPHAIEYLLPGGIVCQTCARERLSFSNWVPAALEAAAVARDFELQLRKLTEALAGELTRDVREATGNEELTVEYVQEEILR